MENDFLKKITEIVEANISNERFGVSELAAEAGMSRSNLLRKVKNLTKLSANQFIRQIRLQHGMEMLKQTSLTVSEVSYKVGFNSTSYFIKCFHDYYGYPPGEVVNRDSSESDPNTEIYTGKRKWIYGVGTILLVVIVVLLLIIFKPFSARSEGLEKSIAVLPFKNDSNDSTNLYIINGLMESVLDNLQRIQDLRVISRTSVEKYRYAPQIIPEIGRELNVSYFVEGSGQKIGDQILLNIQLIEAQSDKQLWSKQYDRETKDIFDLQKEIAKDIATEIEAIITPEEAEQIDKAPTDDLVAYDYFLKGLDQFYGGTRQGLVTAIEYFEKAVEHDNTFARAYADMAISYAFLDMNQVEKKYYDLIGQNADKALLYDPKLPQSLIAKAMVYITSGEYDEAIPYLEKALEYNPNSVLVINILSDFYTSYIPDTEKYLEYALRGIQLDIASHDSTDVSFIYLHLSNAFMQSGFISEAEKYISLSQEYDPKNLFTEVLKAYIFYARDKDLQQTKEMLIETLGKDTSRYDVLKEIGMICYYLRDYQSAYTYYSKMSRITEALNLEVYRGEKAKIGVVLAELGMTEESENYFANYLEYAENDESIYKDLSLAVYHSYNGKTEKALYHFKQFSEKENYPYWYILFLEIDPLIDNIKDHPEFQRIFDEIETKFWEYHKQIRTTLEKEGLL